MARDGLLALLCAVTLFGAPLLTAAPPAEDPGGKLATALAVQKALQEGRDALQRGDCKAAVFILESQVARIDGNRDYLAALREAYRGYVRELQQANRHAEVATYQARLEILDGGAALERTVARTAATLPPTPGPKTSPAPTGTGTKVRAQNEEDPFQDDNRASGPKAQSLLEQAEREFLAHHYAQAGRLFEEAGRIDPSVTAASQERWAYCKLYGVVEALNKSAPEAPPPQELEQEVRRALSMAPKLDDYGKDLLRKIQERRAGKPVENGSERAEKEAAIAVRHQPRGAGGWAVAETVHFRVLHNQSRELAERVARIAESTRAAMTYKWFGDDGGTWNPRCDIFVHATGDDYSRANPGVPATSPGHSTIKTEGERVLVRRIDLHCDDPNMLPGVLPHETTHVVLAGRFGDKPVPRWADEGMAVLSEPRDRIERHLRNLPMHRRDRQLFSVGQLVQMNDYPDPRYVGAFYAESVSVVEFLSNEKGPRVFAQFLRDGLNGGYESALRKHYGYRGFRELEQSWQRYAFGDAVTPATASASGR
jgi:hypothetical protein